ncbi:MAG TPA: PfkB family carbohydrate kinase, partial [Myxococcota bacterium]|nr:PfkB family carbohydrate kinase [Myxococcota bacterium]
MRDIVVVGSLNVDVSLRVPRFVRPGETLRASGLEVGAGGKGLNQAIAAARLGGRVHLVG